MEERLFLVDRKSAIDWKMMGKEMENRKGCGKEHEDKLGVEVWKKN